jgi:hypothetical protein
MKYRVRVDMSFDKESDAQSLMGFARSLAGQAESINEGDANEEIAFCDLELCGHDEGKPCTRLERVEVRKK